jgi:hypothetical protein
MKMKDGRRKFSEEEILKLIRFIEKKPELYNQSSDRSIQHCNEIWNEIAEKMKLKHVTGMGDNEGVLVLFYINSVDIEI